MLCIEYIFPFTVAQKKKFVDTGATFETSNSTKVPCVAYVKSI